MKLTEEQLQAIRNFQKIERTEYEVYKFLASRMDGKNRKILEKIAQDELRHSQQWEKYTGESMKPNRWLYYKYITIARLLGVTFAIKSMENGEKRAEKNYEKIMDVVPEAAQIMQEENSHERMLVNMIDERRIAYIGSMVLGLNDALVELTGALAGLTLALQNTRLVGLAGFITGIAASMSMAASEYLSQKSEAESKNPLLAAFYTGIAYVFTVLLLVLPFFIFNHIYIALAITLMIAILIILAFTFFVSVVKEQPLKNLFWEMVLISFGVAGVSFAIGWLARKTLNVDIS